MRTPTTTANFESLTCRSGSRELTVTVVAGTGEGQTALSAFDAALYDAGVCDFNLLPLSSVIPPHTEILYGNRYETPADQFGHKLYVVKAEQRSDVPGAAVGAGIGWFQWGDGRGCFVEHELVDFEGCRSNVEASLRKQILESLRDLASTRGIPFAEEQARARVAVARVGSRPACALVLAVYEAEGWSRPDSGRSAQKSSADPAIWSNSDFPYACLKDVERTLAFQRAIRHVVRPGDRVVDAGAGTGVLSFFAATAGADQVYAVEIAPEMVSALRVSVALNDLQDRVIVIPGDAAEADLPRNVDVFIGELMETGLLEETQVEVMNRLRERGVIGPRTKLIPDRYSTSVELVDVDDKFYGFKVAAPFHEWPSYALDESGWHRTRVRSLTKRVTIADLDFAGPVVPEVDRRVELSGITEGLANAVRISGAARLAPGLVVGPTNALNGDKILRLEEPIPVRVGHAFDARITFVMGGGLGTFALRREG
jgi:pyruvoyl-dependent arginine decarboxylase